MKRLILCLTIAVVASVGLASGQSLFIPMDLKQTDHLKAYGVAYWVLTRGFRVEWLLNYRGGSFLCPADESVARRCRSKGVVYEILDGAAVSEQYRVIGQNNMDVIQLDKAPKVAVYTPPDKRPWDDAVTLALTYAEIPYETVWDEQVLDGRLQEYDWLHLHHEDFTGQYGKFYRTFRNASWYVQQQKLYESEARRLGYKKVSTLKLTVVEMIRNYVVQGGFLFAMCSATDSFDIALAAAETDICETVFDGDPVDPAYPGKMDYAPCFAFHQFEVYVDPMVYEYSDIDTTPLDPTTQVMAAPDDYFSLFDFSAKYDPVPCMLTQNHVSVVHNFMGQTTGFHRSRIKPSVTVLAEKAGTEEVKYIHGNQGRGTWTFLGGHDPEDYQHFVGDSPTDLSFHKNSPGYRLILNNILFPAARKKEQKT
jgi:hypothetical protein